MKCKFCKSFFPKNKSRPHKKFCSKKCQIKQFVKIHPDKWAKYQKQYRLKKDILCRYCNLPIDRENRAQN